MIKNQPPLNEIKEWETPTIIDIDIRETQSGSAPLNVEDGTYQIESQ